jgi:ATP adenylyltransferase/5',5'''-P-1,P-4-tetraphosphate phosphorylase II
VISDKINNLFKSQLRVWELAERNYSQLDKVLTRSVGFKGFEVVIQFNPQRIKSSTAKVDAKSIGDRPCFLCAVNRPSEQIGIAFGRNLTVLINPYPIFIRHLTITSENHTDQRISSSFGEMLALAEALPDYVIFYNGPQCGASAPDHLHFQAGNRRFMPIENDFSGGSLTELISVFNGTEIWKWKNYLRTILTMKGHDPVAMSTCFETIFDNFSGIQPDKPEPMLNILAYYNTGNWIIHIIPRKVHRPSQFFAEESNKILLSPAAVDLGGVLITPREEDFIKISSNDIADIFRQICLDENDLTGLLKGLA